MRGHGELALGAHAQAFLLDAAAESPEYVRRKGSQPLLDFVQAGSAFVRRTKLAEARLVSSRRSSMQTALFAERRDDIGDQLVLCPALAEWIGTGAHDHQVVAGNDGHELALVS